MAKQTPFMKLSMASDSGRQTDKAICLICFARSFKKGIHQAEIWFPLSQIRQNDAGEWFASSSILLAKRIDPNGPLEIGTEEGSETLF